jgi:hypothetical protein
VLLTKILIPQQRRNALRRPRLVNRLHQHVDRALAVVSAPAGYGKTHLLADFCHDLPFPVCWLSLDESDCDLRTFATNLVAAIQRQFPDFGKLTLRTLETNPDAGRNLATLSNVIVQDMADNLSEFFVLVLDDYHVTDRAPLVGELLEVILKLSQQRWHVIIASRTIPTNLPLVFFTAQDQITFVGQNDLAFSADEARQALEKMHNLTLTLEQAKELVAASEGWITGILLATTSKRSGLRDILRQARAQEAPVYTYLANQVFEEQPNTLRDIMLTMSTLEEMNETLCQQALGLSGAGNVLQELERRGLFLTIVMADDGALYYRYHHLFRDFLQTRLYQQNLERFCHLHKSAAQWFEAHEQWEQAVTHHLASGDTHATVQAMESGVKPLFLSGRLETVVTWYEQVPESLRPELPHLLLYTVRALVDLGWANKAIPLLRQAEITFAERSGIEQAPMIEVREVPKEVRVQLIEAIEQHLSTGEEHAKSRVQQLLDELEISMPEKTGLWFLSLSCPGRVDVGYPVQVILKLSRYSHSVQDIAVQSSGEPMLLQLEAGGLALQGERMQTIALPESQAGEWEREVECVALRPGRFRLTATLSDAQGEKASAHVAISVRRRQARELPQLPSPLGPRPGRQPDLITRVYVTPLEGQDGPRYRFTYVAFSPLSRLRLRGVRMGSANVSAAALAQMRAQLAHIARALPHAPPAATSARLSALGKQLYQALIPPEARKLYHEKIAPNVHSWLVLCEAEPWIPWELLKPVGGSNQDDFWGARFALTRWIEGLGTPRQYEFPLGQVNLTLDERLRSRYAPDEWGALFAPGVVPHRRFPLLQEGGEGYVAAMRYASRVWGLHFEGLPDSLAQSTRTLMERGAQRALSAEAVQEAALDFWGKRPLVTFGMVRLEGQSALSDVERQWVPTFARAGVGSFVGTLWTTEPRADRLFWSAFYRAIWARKPLGEAVLLARRHVRDALPGAVDWLAYFGVGDPMARGYAPKPGEGYASLECVSHNLEHPLRVNEQYEFYARLAPAPPLEYHGRRHRVEPVSVQVPRLMIFAPEFGVEPDRRVALARRGDHFEGRFQLCPQTPGARDLIVKFLDGDEMLQTIDFTVEVEGGR